MKLEKTFRRNIFTALFIATVALANDVNAALVDLGGGMIYDSDQDITWLQDSNYTLHHGLGGRNGQMTWAQADTWARTFTFNGNSGWRLPHGPTANTSGALTVNATGGELYNLYYQLGNTQTSGWKNKGPFSMIWPGSFWTDLSAGWTTSHHWIFDGSLSSNYLIGPDSNLELVWLVRDGKAVAPSLSLTVSFSGSGKGNVTSSPAGISTRVAATAKFPAGSAVVLTAAAAAPQTVLQSVKLPGGRATKVPMQAISSFAGWSGDGSSCPPTQNTCTVTMDKAKTVTVTFNRKVVPFKPNLPERIDPDKLR
ncbi:DUF1566 domain-containing protein [Citrifermentans bremense]|uniref:DUF1566 domain-containing protein n=1 Tax=Citrifermentans bremense TaxID=60035 RepID=UPI00047C842D|nr:DUF1566 domain-containing protein [Citrifermentans bremense]